MHGSIDYPINNEIEFRNTLKFHIEFCQEGSCAQTACNIFIFVI